MSFKFEEANLIKISQKITIEGEVAAKIKEIAKKSNTTEIATIKFLILYGIKKFER